MLVRFDLEKLNEILFDFYKVTSLSVCLWDADNNALAYCPKETPRFCRLMKSTPEGAAACKSSDIALCRLSYRERGPVFHHCHAGLVDVATPILYNDVLLGYIEFGQVIDKEAAPSRNRIADCCKAYNLDEKELNDAYSELIFFDRSTVDAAMRILRICALHLYVSQMISPEKDLLASSIDSYLTENLAQEITVESTCRKFHISKNKLYQLSDSFFGKPFYQYLTDKRIEAAKTALVTDSEPIYLISAGVGIPDYNYFTKVFKRVEGITPHAYRKLHAGKKVATSPAK